MLAIEDAVHIYPWNNNTVSPLLSLQLIFLLTFNFSSLSLSILPLSYSTISDEVRSAAELFPNSSCELLKRQSLLCLFISSFSTLAISLLYNFTIVKLFKIEYFVQNATTTAISLQNGWLISAATVYRLALSIAIKRSQLVCS